jgi:stearoyl-CoA desaturase (delta-9 desaturase)
LATIVETLPYRTEPDTCQTQLGRLPVVRQGGTGWWLVPVLVVCHALVALPLLAPPSWQVLTASLVLCLVLINLRGFAFTAGFHRYFSHHSFKTSRPFAFLLGAFGSTGLRGGPLWWAAHHRNHHRVSDRSADIHRPVDGILYNYLGWLLVEKNGTTDLNCMKDFAKHPEQVWLNRFWLLPSLVLAALCAVAGWMVEGLSGLYAFLGLGFGLSTVLIFHGQSLLDVLAHRWGRRRFDLADTSHNITGLHLLFMGEAWHNNHHHNPGSARMGFFPGELDAAYDMLRVLRLFGIVWDLREPDQRLLKINRVEDKVPPEVAKRAGTGGLPAHLAPAIRLPE